MSCLPNGITDVQLCPAITVADEAPHVFVALVCDQQYRSVHEAAKAAGLVHRKARAGAARG
jgi:hypothetical protein